MKTLQCTCGTKFRVKPEFAGKLIATPCCKARMRVPDNANAGQQIDPDRVRVKCSCGQVIGLNRPENPIVIQCPACQKRFRFGASGAIQASAVSPATAPNQDPFGFPDESLIGPPIGLPPKSMHQTRKPKKKAGKRRKKKGSKKRIPRFGIMKEEFGVTSLIISGIAFLAIFGALGIYLATQAYGNIAKASASENWKSASGRIAQSGFEVRSGRRGKQTATVSVRYSYEVDGSSYTGNTLSFEKQDSFHPDTAASLLKPYPSGANCTVYYDPKQPSKSVLIKGARSGNVINCVMGFLFLLLGLGLAIDSWIGAINASRS